MFTLVFSVCVSFANEQTYNGLVKREIKEKLIRANEVIKSKQLDRYRTFSIIVDDQLFIAIMNSRVKKFAIDYLLLTVRK